MKAQSLPKRKKSNQILYRSKFVLCPRGAGTSSIRMYEVMLAGRVPVIISDNWIAPQGPEWDDFSIRVREKDVKKIPQLLEGREQDFAALSNAALENYNQWFASEHLFHHLAEKCAELIPTPKNRITLKFLRGRLSSSSFYVTHKAKIKLSIIKKRLIER